MSTLARLAGFIATAPLEADQATLETVRNAVVDTFGCILAGADQPVAEAARSAVLAMGARGEVPVFGTALMVDAPHAAFLNAVAGHAMDFDDWEVPGNTHPTVVILPALLACAQTDTNGEQIAKAYLAGFEVIARLGEALNFDHYDRGWHSTATLGAMGAAAGVARLLGLSTTQATDALSIAASRAAGYTCQFGSDAKPMQAGFAAQTGVEAAYLARAGLTGQAHVLDHARGLNALMAGVSANRLNEMLARLGHRLALEEHGLVIKPWPSCGYTHRIMTAALGLSERSGDLSEIVRIDLHLPDFHAAVLPFTQPERREEALFSAPFVAAMGLRYRRLGLDDIKRRLWRDPEVMALIAKTHVHAFAPARPCLNYDPEEPDRMVLTLKSGEILETACAYPIGAPQNPMIASDLRSKFAANAPEFAAAHMDAVFNWQRSAKVTTVFYPSETF